jgi:tRNA(His) guanylyltransferase
MKIMKNKTKMLDTLGDRMKKYEKINSDNLIPKIPTVVRLDGRAFHTYTKQFKKPFDDVLINTMDETAKYLCSKIQGAKFAFVQSDEISIYITDRDNLEAQLWYDGNIQKITSVSASIATGKFNQLMFINACGDLKESMISDNDIAKMMLAEFDSRVFQLPNDEEVVNCFLWRQNDCTRNSISSVAQSLYSAKQLHKVNTKQMQDLIFEKGINWNDYNPKLKRGRFITKQTYINDKLGQLIITDAITQYEIFDNETIKPPIYRYQNLEKTDKVRTKWESIECPIFSQDRQFLLSRI